MFTRCHQVARTPPAFFSLELRRPLRSISTASALSPRSARPIATELPTTPAPMTIASNRSPAIMTRLLEENPANREVTTSRERETERQQDHDQNDCDCLAHNS